MEIAWSVAPELVGGPVRVALVTAAGIAPPADPPGEDDAPPPAALTALLERAPAEGEGLWPEGRRKRVRDMLRRKRFKPTGRSKPASEFLLNAAVRGEFPLVGGPVDVNNTVSLATGYPASVFDLDRTGPALHLRLGAAGESYVFNATGQAIDLEDLVVVCRRDEGDAWEPCGNPVKDAMATKVHAATRAVVAVVYAPAAEPPADLEQAARDYAALLAAHCGARETAWRLG